MRDYDTLPFSTNAESLAAWLDTLASLTPTTAAYEINQIIKLLKLSNLEAIQLYPLLLQLSPPCLYLSHKLLNLGAAETAEKLSTHQIKIIKLSINLLKQLGISFCKLAESRQLDEVQTETVVYYAMQIIGYNLYATALLHEIPSKSLWKNTGVIYRKAFKTEGLEQKISTKIPEFKGQNTIVAVLKRNLLFDLMTPNAYAIPDIKLLFQLSNQYWEMLTISHRQTRDFNFYWGMDAEPGRAYRESRDLALATLGVDCAQLIQALQANQINSSLNPTVKTKLLLELTAYKQIYSSIIFQQTSSSQLLLGYAVICDYLQELDKLSKIKQHGQPSSWDMSLIPLDHEKKLHEFKKPVDSSLPGIAIHLLKTGSRQFVVAKNIPNDCNVGDLCLLFKQQQQPLLTIIRDKTYHEVFGAQVILLEYMLSNVSIYTFKNDAGEKTQILILGEATDQATAILPNGKYTVETKITLNSGKKLNLNGCVEYTDYFSRFNISFDS